MATPYNDTNKLASIKTYIMIAFIFNIIAIVAFALGALSEIWAYASYRSVYDYFGILQNYSTGFLITGIALLVFAALSVIVFMRVRKMYNAVNRGDIATLKSLNNMMWAVLALIFAGVLPGIMLIISFGPINELGQTPPPPPT
jgi:putative membrane protein